MALTSATVTLDVGPVPAILCFARGDTPVFGFYLQDQNGTAIDITGRSYLLTADTLEDPPDATSNIFTIVGVVPTGTDGLVTFQPAAGDLDLTAGTTYYFDVAQTNGTDVRTIIKGSIEIVQDIGK